MYQYLFSLVMWSFIVTHSGSVILCSAERSFFTPLRGKHLRVIWPNWEGNPKGLTGPLKGKVMLDYFVSRFKFTYEYVRVTENWFEPPSNGTRGLSTYLSNNEADLILGGITPRSERIKTYDLSFGYSFEGMTILIPVSDKVFSNITAIVKPFHWTVWLLMLISIAIVTLIFKQIQSWLLNNLALILKNAETHHQNKFRIKITNPYLYVFGNILSQGGSYTVNRLPIRLTAGAWSLAAFVFVQAYTSTLITYVLAPTNYPLISSFRELADRSDIRLVTRKFGTVEFILSSPDPSAFIKKMKSKVSPESQCSIRPECIRQVKSGTRNVYIDARLSLMDAIKERFDETGKCDIQIVDYGLVNVISCFVLQKNSPYTPIINKGIMELRENGIFDFWDSWFRPIPPQCSANIKGMAEKESTLDHRLRRLSLKNLTCSFLVLLVGIGISLIAFLYENISACCYVGHQQRKRIQVTNVPQ